MVKLDEHIGHKVTVIGTVTGTVTRESKAQEKKEGQVEKAGLAKRSTGIYASEG